MMEELEHDFGWALKQLRKSKRVMRKGWNGKGMYIFLELGKIDRVNTDPYITMFTAAKTLQPGWLCSQNDMLATDWELFVENQKKLDI